MWVPAAKRPAQCVRLEYPLVINSEAELDYFLGGLISDVGRAVGNVAKAIDKVAPVSKIAKGIGSVVSAVDKVVPVSLMMAGGVLLRFAGDTALRPGPRRERDRCHWESREECLWRPTEGSPVSIGRGLCAGY